MNILEINTQKFRTLDTSTIPVSNVFFNTTIMPFLASHLFQIVVSMTFNFMKNTPILNENVFTVSINIRHAQEEQVVLLVFNINVSTLILEVLQMK